MVTQFHDALVTVQYTEERVTKGGLRQFLIGAEKTTGDSLSERRIGLQTLNQWKAALCQQAKDKGLVLHIKYRTTRYFDADLLFVELAKDEAPA